MWLTMFTQALGQHCCKNQLLSATARFGTYGTQALRNVDAMSEQIVRYVQRVVCSSMVVKILPCTFRSVPCTRVLWFDTTPVVCVAWVCYSCVGWVVRF